MDKQQIIKKWSNLSKTEKNFIVALLVVVFIVLVYFVCIYPKMKVLQNLEIGNERAKNGYNFIIQNASRVTENTNVTEVDLDVSVEEAVRKVAKDYRIDNVETFEKNGNESYIVVNIGNSISYSILMDALTSLEQNYGVIVKEIGLDKQGDGMIYVSRLSLMRLDEGE